MCARISRADRICVWTSAVPFVSIWIREHAHTAFFGHGSLPQQGIVTISHTIGFDLLGDPSFYDRHEFEIVVNWRAPSSRPGDHFLGNRSSSCHLVPRSNEKPRRRDSNRRLSDPF